MDVPFQPTRGHQQNQSRGIPRGQSRGRGPRMGRGAPSNRPVPNFMDLDCFAPSPGNTWPPPDVPEFGIGPTGPRGPHFPPPPWMHGGFRGFPLPPRGPPRGGFRGQPRGNRGHKRTNQNQESGNGDKKRKTDDEDHHKFWCDPCSRGFKDTHSWDGHKATHTTCGIDGCPYFAAGKLVKLHQDLQHKTGLASKIWALESKESIEKWREERRKNFPTKEKVEEKKADYAARIERGEVLETKHFGKFRKNNGRGRGRGRGRFERGRGRSRREQQGSHHRNNNENGSNHNSKEGVTNGDGKTVANGDGKSVTNGNAPTAADVQKLPEKTVIVGDPLALFEKEKSDDDVDDAAAPVEKPTGIGGALGALMCDYDDSESEPDDTPTIAPSVSVIDEAETDEFSVVEEREDTSETPTNDVTNTLETASNEQSTSSGVITTSDDKDAETTSIDVVKDVERRSADVVNERSRGRRGRERGRGRGRNDNRSHGNSFSTLLEKLLAPDIRHERNVILQCIRHICKNNFFGLNGAAPPSETVVELT